MRKPKLTPEERQLLRTLIADLDRTGRLALARAAIQHGSTTVFAHCVKVACFSLFLANKLHIPVNTHALLRGCPHPRLLPVRLARKERRTPLPRVHPPSHSAENAQEDFMLTPVEKDIIARHMFPLCPIPPRCREAWLVCAADKYCALLETVGSLLRSFRPRANP